METECISYKDIDFLPKLMLDYLNQVPELRPFYNQTTDLQGFAAAIDQRKFSESNREVLVEVLKEQYSGISNHELVQRQIDSLLLKDTFTVTTGHQLCLFTGPLYFIYKILSVIKLADQLNETFPKKHIVPVYWMATEDHDFEEINHFFLKGEKLEWPGSNGPAVGGLKPELNSIHQGLVELLGPGKNAHHLVELFETAYSQPTLADATRWLVHELLGEYGVVVIDADDKRLKEVFKPTMKREIEDGLTEIQVLASADQLGNAGYSVQVRPRDVNLFYLTNTARLRITRSNEGFKSAEGELKWSKKEILLELDQYPERFSPNVLLRPVYQETILPNISYSGGAGEMSYWFELKALFDSLEIPFPILLLRNSALVLSRREVEKLNKLNLDLLDLFSPVSKAEHKIVSHHSDKDLSLEEERKELNLMFKKLKSLAVEIDFTLGRSTEAELAKASKSLDRLEKKLRRGEKRNNSQHLERFHQIRETVFPNGTFQERRVNFSELYSEYGWSFAEKLLEVFEPLDSDITVLIKE